jgi:hypothetical protein
MDCYRDSAIKHISEIGEEDLSRGVFTAKLAKANQYTALYTGSCQALTNI